MAIIAVIWIGEAINPGSITAWFIWARAQAANTENEIYEKYIFQEKQLACMSVAVVAGG